MKHISAKLNFSAVVEWLDSLKTLYWLGKYVQQSDMSETIKEAAVSLESMLQALGSLFILDAMNTVGKDSLFTNDEYGYGVILRQDSPLSAVFLEILDGYEECDDKFYHSICWQWSYWDEVPMPDFLVALLESAAKELQQEWPSLLGTESMAAEVGIKEGMCAISYYDLSNEMLVFASEKDAEAFSEAFPVDPSEFLDFYGDGWHCR